MPDKKYLHLRNYHHIAWSKVDKVWKVKTPKGRYLKSFKYFKSAEKFARKQKTKYNI